MTRIRRLCSRSALVALVLATGTCLMVTSASALDDAKPVPDCHDLLVTESSSDGMDTLGTGRSSDSLEIVRTFFKFDPSKGAEAATLNLQVKNLELAVPAGATGMIWNFKWLGADSATHFVRAVLDYMGGSVFEYGTLDESGPLSRYVAEGDTPGKFFEGPDGVVQLVIPPAVVKPGTTIKSVIAETHMAFQIVPTSLRTPTRGLSYVYDDTAGKTILLAECPPAAAPVAGTRALPVRLLSSSASAKKAKKGKSLSLKLSASEAVTDLTAKLRKGKSSYGKGSLKALNGTGTLKVKLSKKLAKGSYTLDLAAKDAGGNRLLTTAKFKVK